MSEHRDKNKLSYIYGVEPMLISLMLSSRNCISWVTGTLLLLGYVHVNAQDKLSWLEDYSHDMGIGKDGEKNWQDVLGFHLSLHIKHIHWSHD